MSTESPSLAFGLGGFGGDDLARGGFLMGERVGEHHRPAAGLRLDAVALVKGDFEPVPLESGDFVLEIEAGGGVSFGLVGIRERVAALGGNVMIKGRRGSGTVVGVEIPMGREG